MVDASKIALVIALALAGTANADPSKWVGSWSGKVTARGCADDGSKTITLDVAVTSQYGLRSNGDLLQEGFGDLDWTIGDAALSHTREGLQATFAAGKKGAKLALTTDGGCTIKGTLKRASSGIDDCDRLFALATIESQCQAVPSETRGARLDTAKASWKVWSKLRGKKKAAQAKQCRSDADAIASEASACAGGSTGVAACDQLMGLLGAYQACDKIPEAAKDAVKDALEQMKASWASATPDQQAALEQQCEQGNEALKQSMAAMGCP